MLTENRRWVSFSIVVLGLVALAGMFTLNEYTFADEGETVKGYELFYDGKRVGNDPGWDAGSAVNNLLWNFDNRPDIKVEGRFNGKLIELPDSVTVLPLFYVPKGEKPPTDEHKEKLSRHIKIAQERFRELLKGRDTFRVTGSVSGKVSDSILSSDILVYESCNTMAALREDVKHEALKMISELISHFGHDRFNLPYVLLILVMNPNDDVPGGGGRPINGGVDRGGGIVLYSSYSLDKAHLFQSTLQHELGHAFGLLHVNEAFGYDLKTNDSIMSYNQAHFWNWFEPPESQGVLLPDELKILARNKRVFPKFFFDPDADIPDGYALTKGALELGAMALSADDVEPDGCWK